MASSHTCFKCEVRKTKSLLLHGLFYGQMKLRRICIGVVDRGTWGAKTELLMIQSLPYEWIDSLTYTNNVNADGSSLVISEAS